MRNVTVGTTVRKFHCQCMMEDDSVCYLSIKARSEAEASNKVHENYPKVAYVLDIITKQELERRTKHLRPDIHAGVSKLA